MSSRDGGRNVFQGRLGLVGFEGQPGAGLSSSGATVSSSSFSSSGPSNAEPSPAGNSSWFSGARSRDQAAVTRGTQSFAHPWDRVRDNSRDNGKANAGQSDQPPHYYYSAPERATGLVTSAQREGQRRRSEPSSEPSAVPHSQSTPSSPSIPRVDNPQEAVVDRSRSASQDDADERLLTTPALSLPAAAALGLFLALALLIGPALLPPLPEPPMSLMLIPIVLLGMLLYLS